MDVCPKPGELRRFQEEALDDDARRVIASHINGCTNCQNWLDDDRSPSIADELLAAKVVFPGIEGAGPTTAAREFVGAPRDSGPLSRRPVDRNGAGTVPIPDQIGGFRVVARLGGGGQAELFRVSDPLIARELAAKVGRKPFDADSPAERDDLVREARTLAALRHDGLVNVHALGLLEDGRPYLVLDLVRGANLEEHVGAGRLDPRQAAEVVERLAQVVAYLHAHGVIHRDIKPRNVMIDEYRQPRLIDLGLARMRYAWEPEPELSWGGTPAYLSPEQARGEVELVGRATDIFGLGGVLFFLLTGRPLYKEASYNEVMACARRGEYDLTALQDAPAPEPLKQICARALALDPADRYPSAADLAADLKRFLEGGSKPDRSGGRSRWVTLIGSALAASVVFATLWTVAWRLGSRESPDAGKGAPGITPSDSRSPSSEHRVAQVPPGPESSSSPRVLRFEIPHFPKLNAKEYDKERFGILGRSSFAAREDDDVTVQAELSEPSYAYLIAFRPDGTEELCYPTDEDTVPPRTQQPVYPPPARSTKRYRLSEGAGLYAFALVVSRERLPSYREWKRGIGRIPWSAKLPYEPGIVWRDDDHGLQILLADGATGTRGKDAEARDPGGPAGTLASWLRAQSGVDVVTVEAFPVEPASGR